MQGFLGRKLNSGLSWEPVHTFKCGLSKILGAAEEWGCVTENVALKTKLPRRQHGTERIVLTPVQVQMLAKALREPVRSFTLLLVLTGLRVGELLALRWGNVDLKARLLRVVETVYDGHFDKPKTKRGMHNPNWSRNGGNPNCSASSGGGCQKSDICQKLSDAIRLMESLAQAPLKPAAKKLGLSGFAWHLLRHGHATILDGVGTPIEIMRALLAHSAPEITREIYLHAIPEETTSRS